MSNTDAVITDAATAAAAADVAAQIEVSRANVNAPVAMPKGGAVDMPF